MLEYGNNMEVIVLFLTVGEKVKKCRNWYGLKQMSFSKDGISQYYISMIEQEKRQPTAQMIQKIYEVFDQLTQGEIRAIYDKEIFCRTPREQANFVITSRCQTESIEQHYEEWVQMATGYQLGEVLYNLHDLMGKYYQLPWRDEISNQYLMLALHVAIKWEADLLQAYFELATNAKQTLNYKVALNYDALAAQYTKNRSSVFYYKIQYCMAFGYINLNEIDRAI